MTPIPRPSPPSTPTKHHILQRAKIRRAETRDRVPAHRRVPVGAGDHASLGIKNVSKPHWRSPHQIHVLALTGVAYETQATTAVHPRVLAPLRDLIEERDTYTRHRRTSLCVITVTAIRLASCDVCEALVPAGVNPRVQESQGRESVAEAGVIQEGDDGGCDWGCGRGAAAGGELAALEDGVAGFSLVSLQY